MNPGLTLLIRLGLRGALRAYWRRLRTVKGALTALLIAPFVLLVLASQLYVLLWAPAGEVPRPPVQSIRLFMPPLAMLLLTTEVLTGRALAFRPQELDFLFPAPVSRRELLAYHLLSRFPVRLFSALWFALFMLRAAPQPLGGLIAPILLFSFIHVATELIALLGAAAGAWMGRWTGRAVWTGLIGLVLWGAADAVQHSSGVRAGLAAALGSPGVRLATLPMRPFAEVYAGGSPAGVLAWGAVSLALVAACTVLVFALDVAYSDRALVASRRALLRLRRAGAGQAAGVAAPWKLRLHLPRLGFLGRGAPLAWRQSLELARNPRALVLPFVLPVLYLALFLVAPLVEGAPVTREIAIAAIGISVMVPLMMPNVGFDFRRDMDRMAMLRALPLRPFSVAVGQLFAPTLAFALSQVAVVGAVTLASRTLSPLWTAGAILLGVPLTWSVIALDNLLFLWMPYRFSPDGQQNAQFAGKAMLSMMFKMLVLLALGALAGAAAYAGYLLSHGSRTAAVLTASLALFLCCGPLTWAVGAAFRGFNLATDVPS